MKLEYFETLLRQLKHGPVSQRLIFIWIGALSTLEALLQGLEIHHADIVASSPPTKNTVADNAKNIEMYLDKLCRTYAKNRQEPSVLVIDNSILLARYSCDLSVLFRFAISPRAAVVLVFPQESRRDLPPRTEAWVERDTELIVKQIARQLGETNNVVDSSGGE